MNAKIGSACGSNFPLGIRLGKRPVLKVRGESFRLPCTKYTERSNRHCVENRSAGTGILLRPLLLNVHGKEDRSFHKCISVTLAFMGVTPRGSLSAIRLSTGS